MDEFIRKSVKITIILVLGIAAVVAAKGKVSWAQGFVVGAAWSILNIVFTFRLLKIAILQEQKSRLFAMLMLKFPVLYLGGALIIFLNIFPIYSLLLGLLPVFLVMGIVRLCTPNFQI